MKKLLAVTPVLAVIAACTPKTVTTSAPASAPATAPAATPAIPAQATATVMDAAGNRIGTIGFNDTPAGLLVSGTVSGLGLGPHGIHLHAVGICEAPFTSAGGHFNPTTAKHGFRNPAGHHMGDMPNIVTPASGPLSFQFVVAGVTLSGPNGLLDADGAAVVIHATGDDYMTDPAGNSGARLACGVIKMAQ